MPMGRMTVGQARQSLIQGRQNASPVVMLLDISASVFHNLLTIGTAKGRANGIGERSRVAGDPKLTTRFNRQRTRRLARRDDALLHRHRFQHLVLDAMAMKKCVVATHFFIAIASSTLFWTPRAIS